MQVKEWNHYAISIYFLLQIYYVAQFHGVRLGAISWCSFRHLHEERYG